MNFCCDGLKELYEMKSYGSGIETKIPALKDKKHLLYVHTEDLVSTCPAYFSIKFCPLCGVKLE